MRFSVCLAVLIILVAVGSGCSRQAKVTVPAIEDTGVNGSLPLPQRLAFMSGHVKAGLALYRAGALELAAPHLMHPVSETHADEREGLAELGFRPELFETVSRALETGTAAHDIEASIQIAEAHLRSIAGRAGGEPVDLIRFLMEVTAEEYEASIKDGVVSEPGEYQDAYGFTEIAMEHVQRLDGARREAVEDALLQLRSVWGEVPLPPEQPVPVTEVQRMVQAVNNALLR